MTRELTREDYKDGILYSDYSNAKDIIDELFDYMEKLEAKTAKLESELLEIDEDKQSYEQ